jgi:hypothetical protein
MSMFKLGRMGVVDVLAGAPQRVPEVTGLAEEPTRCAGEVGSRKKKWKKFALWWRPITRL